MEPNKKSNDEAKNKQVVKIVWHKAASLPHTTVQSYLPGGANVYLIYRKSKKPLLYRKSC